MTVVNLIISHHNHRSRWLSVFRRLSDGSQLIRSWNIMSLGPKLWGSQAGAFPSGWGSSVASRWITAPAYMDAVMPLYHCMLDVTKEQMHIVSW